jgi:hypothetical protein
MFAVRALKKIRVRDFHQVRRPPMQIVGRDEVVTGDWLQKGRMKDKG